MKIFQVGGAVRDRLLGLKPKDVDYVVVGSTPDEMLKLGFKQVGASFPVFLHPKSGEEWALARIERKISGGYHGFAAFFDPNVTIADDLARRDLTVNAMAQRQHFKIHAGEIVLGQLEDVIIDPYGGQADIAGKTLRHVSNAFAEDPLRLVRLARFSARYDWNVHPSTIEFCHKIVASGELDMLPNERFAAELIKTFDQQSLNLRRFFDLIYLLKLQQHTKFFRNLLGELPHHAIRRYLSTMPAKSDQQLISDFLVPLFGMHAQKFDELRFTAEHQRYATACKNTQNFLRGGPTAEALFAALEAWRYWQPATDRALVKSMVKMLAIRQLIGLELLDLLIDDKIDDYSLAAIQASNICPGEEGPQVGRKVRDARLDEISYWLKEHHPFWA